MITLSDFPAYLSAHIPDASQRQFARRLGISDTYVSLLLSGKKKPSPRVLAAVGLRREIVLVPALAAGARSDETNEDLAQSVGRQSGGKAATPNPSSQPTPGSPQ